MLLDTTRHWVVMLLLGSLLTACDTTPPADAGPVDRPVAPVAVAPVQRVAPTDLSTLTADQLHAQITAAQHENRVYAPAGDNAVEYYVALRTLEPANTAAQTALTEYSSYVVLGAENALQGRNPVEAARLVALLESAYPDAIALPRLKAALASAPRERAEPAPVPVRAPIPATVATRTPPRPMPTPVASTAPVERRVAAAALRPAPQTSVAATPAPAQPTPTPVQVAPAPPPRASAPVEERVRIADADPVPATAEPRKDKRRQGGRASGR